MLSHLLMLPLLFLLINWTFKIFNPWYLKCKNSNLRKHQYISPGGRVVLINSVWMSSPIYYLVVYLVPDYILDGFPKLARSFFWRKGSNRSGPLLVSWSRATLDKTKWGLAIRNLRHLRTHFLNKNGLNILDKDGAF